MKKKKTKPKIKETKLISNPLFIKFLNWGGDQYAIELLLKGILENFKEKEEQERIIQKKLKNLNNTFFTGLDKFKASFVKYVTEAISLQNISEEFLKFLNNSFKYISESVTTYANDVQRDVIIKDSEGRWFEALICYNFIMTFNYFGIRIIKKCPVCNAFFAHKGKYAKYCSGSCKETGGKK